MKEDRRKVEGDSEGEDKRGVPVGLLVIGVLMV